MKKWNELSTTRKTVAVMILLFIASTFFVSFFYKEFFFTPRITITYPDGCEEKYMGKNLTTEECVVGRMINKTLWEINNPKWQYNLSMLNLT